MSDIKPGGLKLKLRKADTNRLKTETGRIKTTPADEGAAEAQTRVVTPAPPVAPPPPAPSPRPDQTAEIRDPMALRDTSQGKLKRIQSPDETASAVAPAEVASADPGGETGIKRETVRLKVVRDKKRGGPQILPSPEEGAQPEVAPPPAPAAMAAPSAQTVKISIPGLKKASPAADASTLKHATATVRVQEPPVEPGSTLKIAPPEGSAEFHETSTATLKLAPRPPGAAPAASEPRVAAAGGPAGTIRITPGPALTAKSSTTPEENKQVTATLKIRPGATAEPPPAPDSSSNKQVTATLKIRSGATEAPEAASTVRITPPSDAGAETAIAAPEDEGAGGNRPALRLKRVEKGGEEAEAAATVRLPGLEEASEVDDASRTVALPTAEEPEPPAEAGEDQPAPATKKGLKFKTAKKHGDEQAEEAPAAEGEAAAEPAPMPAPPSGGPGLVAAIGSMAACAALAALLYRLVTDYLVHLR